MKNSQKKDTGIRLFEKSEMKKPKEAPFLLLQTTQKEDSLVFSYCYSTESRRKLRWLFAKSRKALILGSRKAAILDTKSHKNATEEREKGSETHTKRQPRADDRIHFNNLALSFCFDPLPAWRLHFLGPTISFLLENSWAFKWLK